MKILGAISLGMAFLLESTAIIICHINNTYQVYITLFLYSPSRVNGVIGKSIKEYDENAENRKSKQFKKTQVNMKLLSTLMVVLMFSAIGMNAQEQKVEQTPEESMVLLLSPTFSFSHKKLAYVTLEDGTEIKGNIQDIDREKGLIDFVKIKDGLGKKHKLKPEAIKHMYLPPSGIDKYAKVVDFATDAKKWNDQRLDQNLISQGYAFFEQADVKIKKKTERLLVQLLNPSFSSKISVYHDPKAKETTGLGVGGINVAGGISKSYYIKKNSDAAAYKLTKKDYQKQFKMFWSDSDILVETYGTSPKWRDLTEHIHKYNEM